MRYDYIDRMVSARALAKMKGCSDVAIKKALQRGELVRDESTKMYDETLPINANWMPGCEPRKPKSPTTIRSVVVKTSPANPGTIHDDGEDEWISPLVDKEKGDLIEKIGYECAPFEVACVIANPKDPEAIQKDLYARARFSCGFRRRNQKYMQDIDLAMEVLKFGMSGAIDATLSNGEHVELSTVVNSPTGIPRLVMSNAAAYATELSKQSLKALEIMRKGVSSQLIEATPAVSLNGNGSDPDGKNDPLSIQVTYVKPPPRPTESDTPKD